MTKHPRIVLASAVTLMLSVSIDAMTSAQARSRHHHRTQAAKAQAEPDFKPQGPLTIIVSISKQRLTLYDGMKPATTTMVSTGVAGHETPTGVFTVIQKDRFHHSNIYSNAPMPFMQRITWSGVALHEGHVTGRPASHGCIRLPQAFAMKLWKITKLGVRVIVANDDVSLAEFDAPEIFMPKPAVADSKPDPRASAPVASVSAAPTPVPSAPAATVSGATAKSETARSEPAQDANNAIVLKAADAADASANTVAAAAKVVAAGTGAEIAASSAAVKADVASSSPLPDTKVETKIEGEAKIEAKPEVASETGTTGKAEINPVAAKADLRANAPSAAQSGDKIPEAAKPTEGQKIAAAEAVAPPELPKPFMLDKAAGPLSIFISKRDGKLYVRQNFKPVYETSVSFLPDSNSLGTHVYTLLSAVAPEQPMKWSVATVPSTISLQRERERLMQKARQTAKRGTPPAPVEAAITKDQILAPASALNHVQIPDDARNIIVAALTPSSSLIVSDLGLGSETGKGTDFIVQAK